MTAKSAEREFAVKSLIDRVLEVEKNNLNTIFRSDYYDKLHERDVCLLTFVFNGIDVPAEIEDFLGQQEDLFDDGESSICPYIEYDTDVLDLISRDHKIYPN